MHVAEHRARFDWLVELGGASALAAAAGFSTFKAAPSLGWPGPATMTAGGFAFFALGMMAMRGIKPAPRDHALANFDVEPVEGDELSLIEELEEPLLLDDIVEDDILLLDDIVDDEALLLEDRLAELDAASRVVRLFAAQQIPTPGELKDQIDRHLARTSPRQPLQLTPLQPDATKALFAALDELKRSLR